MRKLISNSSGKIRRVLLVDRDEVSDKRNVNDILKQFEPLIEQMVNHSSKRITFEILVQHRFRAPETFSDEDLVNRIGAIEENEDLEPQDSNLREKNEFHYAKLFYKVKRIGKKKFNYRLIRPNIDFVYVQKELFGSLGKATRMPQSKLPVWIRDPFLVLNNESGEPFFLEPYHSWPDRSGGFASLVSRYVPEIVSSQIGIPIVAQPFVLHGGNILAGDDFVIVNDAIFEKNQTFYCKQLSTLSRDRFYPSFAKILGFKAERCFHIEDEIKSELKTQDALTQLYHLDIFLTLCGKNQDGKQLILLGKIEDWSEGEWVEASEADVLQSYLNAYADALADKLGEVEFEIRRIPILRYDGLLLSYNNCLLTDEGETGKLAFIPKFEWEAFDTLIDFENSTDKPDFARKDKEVVKLLRDLGILAIPIDMGFRVLAAGHAGLDCIVSVLQRESS